MESQFQGCSLIRRHFFVVHPYGGSTLKNSNTGHPCPKSSPTLANSSGRRTSAFSVTESPRFSSTAARPSPRMPSIGCSPGTSALDVWVLNGFQKEHGEFFWGCLKQTLQ